MLTSREGWQLGIRSNVAGASFGYFQRKAHAKYDEMLDDVADTMEEVMQDAATEMKHNISTRGVTDTIPNYDGRGSGDMENVVDHRVIRQGDIVRGQFGWLPGTVDAEQRKIYSWQESGTRDLGEPSGMPSPVPGVNRGIRPMLAMRDAEAHAAEELASRFRGRRRRA